MNWVYMVYGIFTAGQRTWGGPRADAGQADLSTSPQAAIEHALATGDDLNVVPETFRSATEAKRLIFTSRSAHVPSRPAGYLKSRSRSSDSEDGTIPPHVMSNAPPARAAITPRHVTLHPRASWDSTITASSAGQPVYLPRRVESFIDLEGRVPIRGFQAHPPSSQSAYSENRREQASFPNRDLGTKQVKPLSHHLSGSDEAIDMGPARRVSVFREDLDHGASIPLLDLNRSRSDNVFNDPRSSRSSLPAPWHERSPLRLSQVQLVDESTDVLHGKSKVEEGLELNPETLGEGQPAVPLKDDDVYGSNDVVTQFERAKKKKKLSVAEMIASLAASSRRGSSLGRTDVER